MLAQKFEKNCTFLPESVCFTVLSDIIGLGRIAYAYDCFLLNITQYGTYRTRKWSQKADLI